MPDVELEYSPSSRAGGSAEPYVADWQMRSRVARSELAHGLVELAGGSLLIPNAPGAPLLVFIHGGYWQALSAHDSLFLAPALQRLGWSYAALEYPLAPGADLGQMATACGVALAAVCAHPGLQPSMIVLAGHSAGAHLAAMVALAREAPVPIDRLVLVSGVYDLRPLVHTSVNEPLGMDDGSAAAVSPALLPRTGAVGEVVVAWAADDTEAFAEQSRAYAAGLRAAALCCPGRHHFDIVDDLADPSTPLGAATLRP